MQGNANGQGVRRSDRAASALILCLLAAIAIWVYLKGQVPQPDVLVTTRRAATSLQPAPTLLKNYTLQNAQPYNADNLYEYINGQAPYYIAFGFRSLIAAEYADKGTSDPGLVVDIYDMSKRCNAYGIFADTRSPEIELAAIGNAGVIEGNHATFWKGTYFVSVRSLIDGDASEVVLEAAREVAGWIADDALDLREFSALPRENLVAGSLGFSKASFLGMGHLREVFFAQYESGEERWQLFFCNLDSKPEAEASLAGHAEFLTAHGKLGGKLTESGISAVWGEAQYIGVMYVAQRDNVVAGCIGVADRSEAQRYTDEMLKQALALDRDAGRNQPK